MYRFLLFRSPLNCAIFFLILFSGCSPFKKGQTVSSKFVLQDSVKREIDRERPVYHGFETRLTDIIHTKLEVRFDWAKAYLYGKATITAVPYFYSSNRVFLDARGMDLNEVDLLKGEEKVKLDFTYVDDVLKINLDKVYTRNDTFMLFIDYTAKPNELKKKGGSAAITDDKGLYFINPDGKEAGKPSQIWTQGETQSNSVWFPCIDKPNEKMTDEIYMTVDKKYTTLSNGELVYQRENADGTRTDYWNMDLPQSTYLVMMAVGEFSIVKDKWRDKEVNYYVEKEYEPYAKAIFGHTPEMMETFSNLLGVPYVWNKYSQIIVRDYVSGSMENTTATLHGEYLNQTSREMLDQDFEYVIAHELFHQWFGDLVTCKSWSNIPLHESFADYGEYIWEEHEYGRDAADAHRHEAVDKYMREFRRKQVNIVRYDYADREEVFDSHTYEKGGAVLHMLRKYVGDEAFFAALKLYLETNKFNTAEMANLRLAFEKVTGEDLNWFFDEWFFASGQPDLEITHSYIPSSQKYRISIAQKQDLTKTPLFKLPIDIDIYSGGKKTRKRIVLEKQHQDFDFDVTSLPDLVDVDAEKMLICVKKETGQSPAELAFQYHNAPLYEDRREALFGLVKSADTAAFRECILSALNDNFWEIRRLAMSGLTEMMKGNESKIKGELIRLAEQDPKSLVRAEAIVILSDNFKNRDLMPLYVNALKDSSYTVISDGLYAIDNLDSTEAMKIAAGMESEKNKQVQLAVMHIYSRNGGDANNDFFMRAGDNFKGKLKIAYISVYTDFLKRCSNKSFDKALPILTGFIQDKNNYVKLFARNALEALAKSRPDGTETQKRLEDLLKTP
jgi:aminopeptidase N